MNAHRTNWHMWFFVKLYMWLHIHPNTNSDKSENAFNLPAKNLSWEMRISQPNKHPLITQTTTHEYTNECSAVHKGKNSNKAGTTMWSPSDCLHVPKYPFITQSNPLSVREKIYASQPHWFKIRLHLMSVPRRKCGFVISVCTVITYNTQSANKMRKLNLTSSWIYHEMINNSSEDIFTVH